jgi:urea carboxylase
MPGVATTIQDLPGRPGYAAFGVPPGGAWDDLSLSLANIAVGNPVGAAGLEAVLRGPVLRFRQPATVCVAGAASEPMLDGAAIATGKPVEVFAGQTLDLGPVRGAGLRIYLAIRGGLAVPPALGSLSTFAPGRFGGFRGRPVRVGDVLAVGDAPPASPVDVGSALPVLTDSWTLRVIPGPHEYLADLLFETQWRLDQSSGRTGIRLAGPESAWWSTVARNEPDDGPCPIGGVVITGGVPVIAGPDGPSTGGSALLAVVIQADRWRLAQCRPGDRVRLLPVTPEQAQAATSARDNLLAGIAGEAAPTAAPAQRLASYGRAPGTPPAALREVAGDETRPGLVVRRAGDQHVLIEAGGTLAEGGSEHELATRVRIHLLAAALAELPGVAEVVPGPRSLLVTVIEPVLALATLAGIAVGAWHGLPDPATVELPAREIVLPIAFDDPALADAIRRYQNEARVSTPWCPDNVEYLRACNKLASRDEVFQTITAGTYLVVGFAGAGLGTPVAAALDPRHRLLAPRYDPARSWTPAGSVGLSGNRLRIQGADGPGDSQLVGRTIPIWRDLRRPIGATALPGDPAGSDPPWLLRTFDLLRFAPVSTAELAEHSASGAELVATPTTVRVGELLAGPSTVGLPVTT